MSTILKQHVPVGSYPVQKDDARNLGNLTVTNLAITGTLTQTGAVALASTLAVTGVTTLAGVKLTPVNIGTGTPYAVLAANSGRLHIIPDMAANSAINLPAPAAGLNYEFWYSGAAAESHDHTINGTSAAAFFYGNVVHLKASDGTIAAVFSNNTANYILTMQNISGGSIIKVACDGTKWYVTGQVVSDTAPAFSGS